MTTHELSGSGEARIGPYLLKREIGRGGQGRVYLAVDGRLGRRVALKVMDGGAELSPTARLRFRAEAERAAKLDHPGVARVYEWGDEHSQPYIAMEFVEGRTLADHIRSSMTRTDADVVSATVVIDFEAEESTTVPPGGAPAGRDSSGVAKEAIGGIALLIEQAARALHAAHEAGLVHRDVKPGNIMVHRERGPVILDFGLASDQAAEGPSLTMTGDLLGTPAYMSPEQLAAKRIRVDRRTDVYSLGATLFECLALRRPFEAPSREQLYREILTKEAPDLRRLNPVVPKDLAVVVACALEKDPDRRYKSALDFADDLRRFREREPIRARPVGLVGRLVRWSQRNPAVAALMTTVLLSLSAAIIWTAAKNRELARAEQETRLNAEAAERNAKAAEQNAATARRQEEQAMREAREKSLALADRSAALAEKTAALAEYERLADARRLANALEEADRLWPVHPNLVPEILAWQEKYEPLFSAVQGHKAALLALRELAQPYGEQQRKRDFAAELARLTAIEAEDGDLAESIGRAQGPETRLKIEESRKILAEEAARIRELMLARRSWSFGEDADLHFRHDSLSTLVEGLEAASAPGGGLLVDVSRRLDSSRRIHKESIEDRRLLWEEAAARISSNPLYAGLALSPQIGLIPLGPDPLSKLEEFLHWQTHDWTEDGGALPARGDGGHIGMTETRGVILVLIPGGSFLMGAQMSDHTSPNHDPDAQPDESPVHAVTLSHYMVSKYEMTQGQWLRAAGGNPSQYGPGFQHGAMKAPADLRHPVEMVSWNDADRLLSRLALNIPTEAQWERAARAQRSDIWAGTSELAQLSRLANIAGAETVLHFPTRTESHRDPFIIHAPAGAFEPNGFGLYDMSGNIWEWCRDGASGTADYGNPPRPGDGLREGDVLRFRNVRGGSFDYPAQDARVAVRNRTDPGFRNINLGLRPSKTISP